MTISSLLATLNHFARTFLSEVQRMSASGDSSMATSNDRRPWEEPDFDPTAPGVPISYPITDLETLRSGAYFDSFHFPFNRASVPLPGHTAGELPLRRRLLVCHDMQGGYRDDAWAQGGGNPNAYTIWNWGAVDVFVYFSHYLVTIPPPVWVNAAHTHGTKVLGTFIMEWDEGKKICEVLLSSKDSAEMYGERLTELATALGFDGWLINIEVNLTMEQVDNLKYFLNHLTRTMHNAVPGSLVIWYDAVTVDGRLRWQDQLNELNKPFFDLCDGIFVNYTWKEVYPKTSAAAAGSRKYDVYMGIDVFGRNTFGGGQWNTDKALNLLRKDDISAAVFAPGWVYETKQGPDFQTAQNRWWSLVEKSWGLFDNYVKHLPFYSNFDQGHGYEVSVDGLEVYNKPWNNISCQSFQPSLDQSSDPVQTSVRAFVNFRDKSFSGGASITVNGSIDLEAVFSTSLFHARLQLDDLPLHVTYSIKTDRRSAIGLCFELMSESSKRSHALIAVDVSAFTSKKLDYSFEHIIHARERKSATPSPWTQCEATLHLSSGYQLTVIGVVCSSKTSTVDATNDQETSSPVATSSSSYSASLGHISLKNSEHTSFPDADSWRVEGKNIAWSSNREGSKSLSLKIAWELKSNPTTSFAKYNIYMEKQRARHGDGEDVGVIYIGTARTETFYVWNLEVPKEVTRVKFVVQVCGFDGDVQELGRCPTFDLPV